MRWLESISTYRLVRWRRLSKTCQRVFEPALKNTARKPAAVSCKTHWVGLPVTGRGLIHSENCKIASQKLPGYADCIDITEVYHAAGASDARLAFAMATGVAYLRSMEKAGLLSTTTQQIGFHIMDARFSRHCRHPGVPNAVVKIGCLWARCRCLIRVHPPAAFDSALIR